MGRLTIRSFGREIGIGYESVYKRGACKIWVSAASA